MSRKFLFVAALIALGPSLALAETAAPASPDSSVTSTKTDTAAKPKAVHHKTVNKHKVNVKAAKPADKPADSKL